MKTKRLPRPQSLKRRWVAMALVASLAGSPIVQAQTDAAPQTSANTTNFTFKQLGRKYPMHLRGVESSDSLNFNIRADQVARGARLTLQYAYSPALLPDLSHINILVNDEVAASIPLPKENSGVLQKRTVDIPAHLITEFNRLSIQFIGHYTMNCEDPLHSSLWAKISSESELEIQTAPLALQNDLSILPLPFFDYRDIRQLNLPFIFQSSPDHGTLEAAGILSSWFGALAGYRGAKFPALLNTLPTTGNAIVFVINEQPAQVGGLPVDASKGASVNIVPNPNDANGKLLVVAGRNADELKKAAISIALGSKALTGNKASISKLDAIAPRKPYDAPNWIRTDRPVKLGELIDNHQLNVSSYDPGDITIPINLPPDLFQWRQDDAPMSLKYRYTPQPQSNNSSLIVRFNDRLIKSDVLLPTTKLDKGTLGMIKNDMLERSMQVTLPLNSAALQSRLQIRYMYDYVKEGECKDVIIDNMRGSIDPESTIDLTSYNHFIAMPNLGVFKDGGFPFTRMADLSQTAVVLPDNASSGDLGAYLTILGRFGKVTGYPATNVSVVDASSVEKVADNDLLVIASGANQPLLSKWVDRLPALVGDQQRFDLSDLALKIRNWFSPDPEENKRKARLQMAFSSDRPTAYLTGFESPLSSGRSVVVVNGGSEKGLEQTVEALSGIEGYVGSIEGSLVTIRDHNVEPIVAEEQYFVGSLSPFRYVQWLLSRHVFLLLLITIFGVVLLSALAYWTLRAKAKKRLEG